MLDAVVLSAPYSASDGIPAGVAQLSGTFTQAAAGRVVDLLNSAALPTTFAVARD
ncbi:MAG TPA: hypothetical protein VHV79_06005 [Mycobacteriales bacterium]|nr:hypothetical protein [Mycobacteriales bacterium]